jgi:membrane associated rhomboid family serine protease
LHQPLPRRGERKDAVSGLSTAFIVLGLFLLGGVYSFVKQGLPKSIVVLLGIGAAMSLTAGILRLEVWN